MRNSLFKRYTLINVLTLVVSLVLLGCMLMFFIRCYWENDQKHTLTQNSEDFASVLYKYTEQSNGKLVPVQEGLFSDVLVAFSKSLDCDLYFCDKDGNINYAASFENTQYADKKIPTDFLKNVGDSYYEKGRCGGLYDEDYLVSVKAYKVDGETAGYGFSAVKASQANDLLNSVLIIFVCCSLGVLAVMGVIIGLYSFKSVKPLKEMSAAAKAFALGDFSSRVTVNTPDEIGELAAAFNDMADSLSTSETMRRSFIANVSHELKTPMTTISGFIDGILDGTISPQDQKSYLKTVSNEVKRLSRLVTSMLSLSRIDAGELVLKKSTFNLTNIIIQTLFTFEQTIEKKCIDVRGLELLDTVTVEADRDLIYQVIYNLFENATKFTNYGGYIEVKIDDTPTQTSVSIINSGNGISPEDLPLVFDKFYKTDKSRNEDKKGMGLGLYIVRTIMHLHGGEITVNSELNKYTDFTFRWPKPTDSQQS